MGYLSIDELMKHFSPLSLSTADTLGETDN